MREEKRKGERQREGERKPKVSGKKSQDKFQISSHRLLPPHIIEAHTQREEMAQSTSPLIMQK